MRSALGVAQLPPPPFPYVYGRTERRESVDIAEIFPISPDWLGERTSRLKLTHEKEAAWSYWARSRLARRSDDFGDMSPPPMLLSRCVCVCVYSDLALEMLALLAWLPKDRSHPRCTSLSTVPQEKARKPCAFVRRYRVTPPPPNSNNASKCGQDYCFGGSQVVRIWGPTGWLGLKGPRTITTIVRG